MTKPGRILVMAGGTGGHVFPGLAVAKKLQSQGWEVLWLGTAERMEAQLVPKHGFEIAFIDIKGVRGNGIARKLAAPFKLLNAVRQARSIIQRFKPDVVLGMGGYASGPGGIAAWLSGIPLVLHEQNAAAGMTNRYLAKVAAKVMLAFPGALPDKGKTQVVGNPVRKELLELISAPREAQPYRLLVIGGSLGAQVFNQVLPEALAKTQQRPEVRHQVGRHKLEDCLAAYTQAGFNVDADDKLQVTEFIDDMSEAYEWADVILCRAGALTVSEVAVVGLPAIFVPLPYAVDDHQTKNARYLVDAGAASLLPQNEFEPQRIADLLDEFADPAVRKQRAEQAKQCAVRDATEQVAAACQALRKSA